MNMKKVKAFLAAGALTGIVLATVVGLSLRNVARAVVVAPVPAQSTTTLTTNNQSSGFFESEHHEQQGGDWFSDD